MAGVNVAEKHIVLSNGVAEVFLNPAVYSVEAVYSASFVFLDRAYIILDKDEKSFIVRIKPKKGFDAGVLALEFFNELINYSGYLSRASASAEVKKLLLAKALFEADEDVIIPWEK